MPHFPKEPSEITWSVDRQNLSAHRRLTDGSDRDGCVGVGGGAVCVCVFTPVRVLCVCAGCSVSVGLQY